jgi:riboflavin synthase
VFTGIVQAIGTIVRTAPLEVECPAFDLSGVALGDSICVQGVCLTVIAVTAAGFRADVSEETRRVTAGLDRAGARVNLEKSLTLADRLGGHLVTGHVDGVGEVLTFSSGVLRIRVPHELARFIARKGSICVDGVSLTVNGVEGDVFDAFLIPRTQEVTTLGRLAAGARVNLEVDLVARYVERLLATSQSR